jgi:alpha-ketoglutarate-dependent taurine dioxygenase
MINIQSAVASDGVATVSWSDGATSRFHYFWLRDNCPQLRHGTTNHRVVETSEVPAGVSPSSIALIDDHSVQITWDVDGHVSTFTGEWLRANDYSNGVRHPRSTHTLWDGSLGEAVPSTSYPALRNDPAVRQKFLEGFLSYGVGLLSDVPCEPGTVLEVGTFLGELRSTSWGTVFDVISMEDANSVAYTNLPLVTHTDEGYRNPAPTVQLQHFLRADASGGESTLTDGFAVAEHLRTHAPQDFALLSQTMLKFHFADSTAEHQAYEPIISLYPDGSIKAIRYSNHSVLPFLLPFEEMDAFYTAYRNFGTLRESDQFQFRVKMGAGDLYMVDNHRVMHGRTGFSSGGARHLQSCYIERDELESRLTVLKRNSGR